MPEYNLVKKAALSPTACRFCGDHVGPFIDTFVDDPIHGHVYVCAPHENRQGCVGQMAFKCGFISPDEAEQLREELQQARDEVTKFYSSTFTFTPGGVLTAASNSATVSTISDLRWLGKDE